MKYYYTLFRGNIHFSFLPQYNVILTELIRYLFSNIAHQFMRLLLLIMEHEVIACCTICHIMSMKLIVLFSVLLDQFLMFLVYSINFYAHNN